jgi:glycosyltransferase involved in cell wall biosynthesis
LVSLPLAARRDRAELLHVQYTVSPLSALPTVTTVHDVSFLIGPEWFRAKDRWLLRLSVPRSIRRAARTITVSETSRRDIIQRVRVPDEKVIAIPLAAPPEFAPVEGAGEIVRSRLGLDQPYALALGTLQPRKNLPMAARAFAEARRRESLPHVLAIAGKTGWGARPKGEGIRLLGYVDDGLLPALYSAADAFLFPSLYEGFGIPVLEAMSCGCPVVCSDGGALPEVASDAAMVLPARNEGAWSDGIARLLTDAGARERLRRAGAQRATMFSWRETARRTLAVYEEVLT